MSCSSEAICTNYPKCRIIREPILPIFTVLKNDLIFTTGLRVRTANWLSGRATGGCRDSRGTGVQPVLSRGSPQYGAAAVQRGRRV